MEEGLYIDPTLPSHINNAKITLNTADAYMKSKFFLKEKRANLVNYLSMARKSMGTLFQLKEIRYISSVLSLDRAMFFKKFIE